MPGWLQALARVNPLTYEVHGMRQLMLGISTGGTLWVDFAVVAGFLALMAAIAARLYPRAIL
jgi:ABC-2 type transport system permease protein